MRLLLKSGRVSERDFTRSVRGLWPNHIKVDCSHEASGYRGLTDIEVSEATFNCKIGSIEILLFKISILTITWYFYTPSKAVVHRTKLRMFLFFKLIKHLFLLTGMLSAFNKHVPAFNNFNKMF